MAASPMPTGNHERTSEDNAEMDKDFHGHVEQALPEDGVIEEQNTGKLTKEVFLAYVVSAQKSKATCTKVQSHVQDN
jgi:hypothetical protein